MNNIGKLNRAARLVLTFAIVFAVLNVDGPIHNLVYALLLSIYTGLTAFIGWDPAVAAMGSLFKHASKTKADATHSTLSHHH